MRIWDVENQANTMTYEGLINQATGMRWSPKGDLLGVMVKGGNMIVFDPRKEGEAMLGKAHLGPKA